MKQSCYVKWNSKKSKTFEIKNGVRQGAILSPCLFCVYLDTLLTKLRESGLGCHIGNLYFGAFGYADDVILLSPSRKSLQLMLNICQDFAKEHSMQFSTDPDPRKSKTKCLHFTLHERVIKPLKLNDDDLPWVKKALHLGNTLTTEISKTLLQMKTSSDLLQKRAIFFENVHELKQAYGFYEPKVICEIIRIFGTSFYGSPLWDLTSEEHLKLNRSWNTVIKILWDLPYATHKRYLESLTEVPHIQSTLHSRYLGFISNLNESKKPHLQMLFHLCHRNHLSNTGRNISYLQDQYEAETLQDLIRKKQAIKKFRVYPLNEGEVWKIGIIEELSLCKRGCLEIDMEKVDIDAMLEAVTTD